jgi:predicted nucleotidyltransferase
VPLLRELFAPLEADRAISSWRPSSTIISERTGRSSELREALRPDYGVRLAVRYGSLARGDEDEGSDLDLLVALADDHASAGFVLATRLQSVSGRRVDIAHLVRVEAQAPLLLDRVLDEGRVVTDSGTSYASAAVRSVPVPAVPTVAIWPVRLLRSKS